MRVLITGGTGLIGRALSANLAADGHEVIVLSRSPEQGTPLPDRVQFERWDSRTAEGWGHLVDGDPAANNGGWQWTAGTGTDAAPYFRIFDPVLQGKEHDPAGIYVRRWVPELDRGPEKYIHEPWKMPLDVQKKAGCTIGQDYAYPIIDHAWARERTLNAYRFAREMGP